MAICDMCGKHFDREDADTTFSIEHPLLNYNNFRRCLCAECAMSVMEELIDGEYFETCEKCGKTFDLILEKGNFDSHFSWANGTDLLDYWQDGIICADCALDKIDEESDYEEEDDDDESDEEY